MMLGPRDGAAVRVSIVQGAIVLLFFTALVAVYYRRLGRRAQAY